MKKLLFVALAMSLMSLCAACEDASREGEECVVPGGRHCDGNTLYICSYWNDNFNRGVWMGEECSEETTCFLDNNFSDCYKRCTSAEVNQIDPDNERKICSQANDDYYYVYK